MGIVLGRDEMAEVFGDFDPTSYEAEAEQRWGGSEAYRESRRRTSSYTKQDWLEIKADGDAVVRRFVAALAAGLPADGPEAMAAAEAHRAQISRRFFDCSYDVHRGLAEMYVSDPRFTEHYEAVAPGLATYVHDAIVANASHRA